MPTNERVLVALRGTERYAKGLADLAEKVGARNLSELVDDALRRHAKRHGIEMPERVKPHGTNQHATKIL